MTKQRSIFIFYRNPIRGGFGKRFRISVLGDYIQVFLPRLAENYLRAGPKKASDNDSPH